MGKITLARSHSPILAAHAEGHVLKDMKDMAMFYKTRVRFNNYNGHTQKTFQQHTRRTKKKKQEKTAHENGIQCSAVSFVAFLCDRHKKVINVWVFRSTSELGGERGRRRDKIGGKVGKLAAHGHKMARACAGVNVAKNVSEPGQLFVSV